MKDLIIIGSGPAGVSAALTAKRRNLDFLWFGNKNLSPKVELAHRIDNYPGLTRVTGLEMNHIFKEQIKTEKLEVIGKMINQIMKMGDHFMVSAGSDVYEAKTIVLASGVIMGKFMDGEKELAGKGVSYCATCDGMFYREKEIAVVCENKEFEEEVLFLANIAKKVYLFVNYETTLQKENIEIHKEKPCKVEGENKATGIVYKEKGTNEDVIVDIDGIFVLRDSINPNTLLKGLEMDEGHIIVDRTQATSVEGVYAAGDCTGRPYQYAKAVGEGNVAIYGVTQYLAGLEEGNND